MSSALRRGDACFVGFSAPACGGCFVGGLASAQSLTYDQTQSQFARDRNIGVLDRPRPDYDALGVCAGAFLVSRGGSLRNL